ncbi:heavy-metal resistance protein [Novosphingobium kunmingense]|uniref:Heavy-metal resistance protein n=1 Tax=Novosphingobium kunmingense TaxID=1211806 RepID=A0A2N0HJJ8_9SPHN|nr:periplasmic heavy metal sensor [Novosphingobium kunmingense]PKB19045.1 heavy-metal resistance protein [Novosphingobium kunmingense]
MGGTSRYLLVAVVAFAVAIAACWLVRDLIDRRPHHDGGELHVLMHDRLGLDPAQKARIEAIEARFAQDRKALDQRLFSANRELAEAMANEHAFGPRVALAVDHSHMAMGDLQKATLRHVFAMRAVLRPDQTAKFDAAVKSALIGPAKR